MDHNHLFSYEELLGPNILELREPYLPPQRVRGFGDKITQAME